jgi:UDP-perosamine 4-acetyltransferase
MHLPTSNARQSEHTDIIIVGGGGHGRVIADLCASVGITVKGFADPDFNPGDTIDGILVLGGDDIWSEPETLNGAKVILGIGSTAVRSKLLELARLSPSDFATLVHASAVVSDRASLETGTIVCAGGIVGTGSHLSRHVVINTAASVDHDCRLGNNVQVSPGAVLAGGVICGDNVFIGSGATVIAGIEIGEGALVAAGAVVTSNIAAGAKVAGVPATRIA